jgi:hypothetical protein
LISFSFLISVPSLSTPLDLALLKSSFPVPLTFPTGFSLSFSVSLELACASSFALETAGAIGLSLDEEAKAGGVWLLPPLR